MVHENSKKAHAEEQPKLSTRSRRILDYMQGRFGLTDRCIMSSLGYTDMNDVRPRISELIADGLMVERGSMYCKTTGRQVRLVCVAEEYEKELDAEADELLEDDDFVEEGADPEEPFVGDCDHTKESEPKDTKAS